MNRMITALLFLTAVLLAACQNNPAATPLPPTNLSPTLEAYPRPQATNTPAAYPAAVITVEGETAVPRYTYRVVETFPHDPGAFTQGLVFENGILCEGTGQYGQSTLRRVDLATGKVQYMIKLPEKYFGEGITTFNDWLIQITWKEHTGFVYDKESFELLQQFSYPTEGWGITHDGQKLIMSDGTANLYFWDPETLEETGRVEVHDENGPIVRLNELEFVNGEVWANVWLTDLIARIDPETGRVVGWIDLTGLLDPAALNQRVDVLNGIAYDAAADRLFVTGKWWPKLFEIELVPLD